jgi:tetratricopeptide (TPR) repeat protein
MLYAASGGNPLFIDELVLALREAGQLEHRAGEWHVAGELQATPHIVREIIAERVQNMGAGSRNVLAMGSVLGQSFEHGVLLAAVAPLDEEVLLSFVDQAISAHTLQRTAAGYAFRHALMREAVYWGMTAPRRKLLHARAGDVLERLYGGSAGDHASELAHHFSLAGESREMRAKSLRYSLAAGRRATALSSHAEALEQFERATRLIDADTSLADADQRVKALSGRGLAESSLSRHQESVGSFRQALTLTDDPVQRGRTRSTIAYSLARAGALQELLVECEAGMDEVKGVHSPAATEIRATLLQLVGWAMYRGGRFADAIRVGDRIQQESAPDEHTPRMLAHRVTGYGYMGLGHAREGIRHAELSLAEAERCGDNVSLAMTLEFLGHTEYAGGRFDAAREHLARALAVYRESANEHLGLWAIHVLCRVWLAEGEHVRASEQIRGVLHEELASQWPFLGDAHYLLGLTQSICADWGAARESFEQAIHVSTSLGDALTRINATVALGFVEQCVGRLSCAEARYLEGLILTHDMGPCPHRVMTLRHLGRLRLLQGDRAAAEDIGEAARQVKAMPESLEFAPTLVALAELRSQEGRIEEARALAQAALESAHAVADRIEAHLTIACANLRLGNVPVAISHAKEAVARSEALQAPMLLGAAYRGLAEAAAADGQPDARLWFAAAQRVRLTRPRQA